MNEQEIALLARRVLDESVERLPYRVTQRLAASRALALARMQADLRKPVDASSEVRLGARGEAEMAGGPPRLGWRVAAVIVPILIVGVGLAGISVWGAWQRADDLADLDVAMLADEVPISAYADRGFGVYLKNVSQANEP